jgi:glutamyl-tRNA synthetase
VTLGEIGVRRAFAQITASLGWPAHDLEQLLDRFDPDRLPRHPWIYVPD